MSFCVTLSLCEMDSLNLARFFCTKDTKELDFRKRKTRFFLARFFSCTKDTKEHDFRKRNARCFLARFFLHERHEWHNFRKRKARCFLARFFLHERHEWTRFPQAEDTMLPYMKDTNEHNSSLHERHEWTRFPQAKGTICFLRVPRKSCYRLVDIVLFVQFVQWKDRAIDLSISCHSCDEKNEASTFYVIQEQKSSLAGEPEGIVVVLIQDDALGAMVALAEDIQSRTVVSSL